jgi:hypothetical protein
MYQVIEMPKSEYKNGVYWYSYCLNNPLKYSDPSGMLAKAYDESDAALDSYFHYMTDIRTDYDYRYLFSYGGGGGSGGSYHYNRNSGDYENSIGEPVSWGEVYNNYIVHYSEASLTGKPAQDFVRFYVDLINNNFNGSSGASKVGSDRNGNAKVGSIPETATKYIGNFYGANVYSNPAFNNGSALTLGSIYVGENVWNNPNQLYILQHEYGHYLQLKEYGAIKYILKVGFPSFNSARVNDAYTHNRMPFEIDANIRSYNFFDKPTNWNSNENPLFK